jgi:glycosyltransferase involved in cell wall biosynthesis
MKVVILAFNIGMSKRLINGPGMDLLNFAKFVSKYLPNIRLCIYTRLESFSDIPNVKIKTIKHATSLMNDIKECKVFHCWSGLTKTFSAIIQLTNTYKKPIILGPNLLDVEVKYKRERFFLKNIEYQKILTVNDRLKYLISSKHALPIDKFESFLVGPDIDLWTPPDRYDKYILWKGNSRHMVKDIGFAKKIESNLKQYEFLFFGDGRPYNYKTHIKDARKAYLYICTSLSETKGTALMEQWSAGVPSITHPKVYLHGENYRTGIITNRDVDSYCEAISEIMENSKLRKDLSLGSREFMLEKFNPRLITEQYLRILENVG